MSADVHVDCSDVVVYDFVLDMHTVSDVTTMYYFLVFSLSATFQVFGVILLLSSEHLVVLHKRCAHSKKLAKLVSHEWSRCMYTFIQFDCMKLFIV